jgi:signal peptidase II
MAERTYRFLFWVVAVGGTLLDQVSKYGVFRWLLDGYRTGYWPGDHRVFWLETIPALKAPHRVDVLREWLRSLNGPVPPMLNEGALFGLGQGNNLFFSVISVAAAVAIVYWTTRRTTARDWVLCTSLGLILAGTLGNLYDRVIFGGVRDFLHFEIQGVINWPIFNLADSCLVCGAVLLLLQACWTRTPTPGTEAAHFAGAPETAGVRKS